MATIALVTAERIDVLESIEQATLVAAEAIVAGAPVRIDTNGKFTNGNGTSATEAAVYGVATRTVAAGMGLTAIRKGVIGGLNLDALAFWASVYVSDTDGRLDTAAGTTSLVVGHVLPVGKAGAVHADSDKVLLVDIRN